MSTNVLGGAMELESPILKPFISIAVNVSMPKPEVKVSQETGCLHSFRAAQHNSLLITNGEQLNRHQAKKVTGVPITVR